MQQNVQRCPSWGLVALFRSPARHGGGRNWPYCPLNKMINESRILHFELDARLFLGIGKGRVGNLGGMGRCDEGRDVASPFERFFSVCVWGAK